MNITELKNKLIESGCTNYSIMVSCHDCNCIKYDGKQWIIYYSERGIDYDPIYKSNSEEDACEYFIKYLLKQNNWHLVTSTYNINNIKLVSEILKSINVECIRNDCPGNSGKKYRIFVNGPDIHKVNADKRLLGNRFYDDK